MGSTPVIGCRVQIGHDQDKHYIYVKYKNRVGR